MAKFISVYPAAFSADYVKATTQAASGHYAPHYACDPSKSLTGTRQYNSWISSDYSNTNQRFHIWAPCVLKRIYYQNIHDTYSAPISYESDLGAKNVTLWGSNWAESFAELTYGTDTGWTQLSTTPLQLARHPESDTVDPRYITVYNNVHYKYYAFKFADAWGSPYGMGVRRIELQTIVVPQIIIF